jgi:hypothetical protein
MKVKIKDFSVLIYILLVLTQIKLFQKTLKINGKSTSPNHQSSF